MKAQVASRSARPGWLVWLAALAVGLVGYYYYFTGETSTLPLRTVPHLQPQVLTLDSVAAGPVYLPVQASGFVTTLTHDVAGPYTQPVAAAIFLLLLAGALVGWVAVVSTLARGPFVAGMVPVIFLLMSLSTESLGLFGTSERYFLYLMLGLIGGGAFGLHAFAEGLTLRWRVLIIGGVVAALSVVLYTQSLISTEETTLELAAYATTGGAVLLALLVLWVGVENVRALLWLNTQAEQPAGRFGLVPFVLAAGLYVGTLLLYIWNNGNLELWPGLTLDPLVLLLPAVVTGWLGLRLRVPSYGEWLPYGTGAAQLYPLAVLGAAGALGYAFATANTPLLVAARSFTGAALGLLGAAFLLYVLINFGPLIKQRLRVYRVVFEPRRLPFYAVYVLGIGGIIFLQSRQSFPLPDQVRAGQFNMLGDLARQQSEAAPDDLAQAGLAERYYAESGDVLYRANLHAELGRAALYRFRQQRQNEINSLRRALLRGPNEKVSVRLASLYDQPDDLFEGLDILRRGLKAQPHSAPLAGDLAQLFTQTALTDSVAHYLDKAEQLAPGSYASRTNQLGYFIGQNLLNEARAQAVKLKASPDEPALLSNLTLLQLRTAAPLAVGLPAPGAGPVALDAASFAQVYHSVLLAVIRNPAQLTPALFQHLNQLASQPANADYYEQLLFLQALGRHARGQELLARQLLLPLASGTSATAAYYQQLLGLWQLQQGQYATAADQLGFAASHGAPQASAMRVYALALSGEVDSVKAATARLLALADTAQQRQGRRVQEQLALPALSAKSAARIGADWLATAQAAAAKGEVPAARGSYQRIVREAPFNEAAVLAAAAFYTRQGQAQAAYAALRAGLNENPASLPLLRAYVLAAADAGLTEYAAEALAELRRRLPPAAAATLAAEYAARQAARTAAAASFAGAPAVSPGQ
ncbi:hypothetical protein MON38_03750 [Hymenobacter sp. DH14]|uniref:Tetratricopeptide repeat protein n=1 Tax=Hymenobacter cyanobacteriorum TaxID=2926463 RepID=A0A9X2AFI2_9BACT|nr:hypothetical protein [Hymenobacter cyanobacteriorum]MCI1186518.1 hypothetical protein [Hymenobacter cyanobacteriorum]